MKQLFGFENKNVLVTGAGSGMGHAAARLLTELGANVYATVRRKPMDFPVTKELHVNLDQKEELDELIKQLPQRLDALFICHGISNSLGNTNGMAVQITNFLSFQYLTEKLLPRVPENGSVTFISSNGGKEWRSHIGICQEIINAPTWEQTVHWFETHPKETAMGYTLAKECQHVYVMSKCQKPEFAGRRIRLNAIAPGLTKTGLSADFNASITGDAAQGEAILERLYLGSWNGRWAAPEEMGYPMVAVGSRLFSYMSGQILYIDFGGASDWEFRQLTEA